MQLTRLRSVALADAVRWAERSRLTHAVAAAGLLLLGLLLALLSGAGPAEAAGPSCPALADFSQAVFSDPTTIDNKWLPLVPGTRLVLDGTARNDAGKKEPHRVTFTVTDATKVIQGVRTVVAWDVDESQGQLQETELSFFAQDDAGNVWNLGEYPEEFEGATFVGAPSTWLAGYDGAQPGVHMAAAPAVSRKFYLQGFSEGIEFEDCARVNKMGQTLCIPAKSTSCYQDVLITEEKDAFDPSSGLQTKAHAPGIGIVKIAAVGDPLGETLELTSVEHLDAPGLERVRQEALVLDQRGYQFGGSYRLTAPAVGPPAPPPVPQPVVQPPVVQQPRQTVETVRLRSLSPARAKAAVRRALLQRLKGWRITRINCKSASRTRANCGFVATTRRGSRAGGLGVVTMRGGEGLVRYSLRARVVKGGCRPVSSRTCTRRSVWKSR